MRWQDRQQIAGPGDDPPGRRAHGRRQMNIEHMPELRWRLGYPYALGLMVALAAGLWGFFKRKGWL